MAEGDRSQPPLPKRIGRYEIQGSLGAGAMGAVYKGFDPLIKRTLAIKTIRLDIARGSEEYKTFLERFYQEARISGTLSHPNIVTLFDIGEDNGLPFLALEFIEGDTIESLLARGVKFRPEKVIGLISQIAAALDYAHSKGVIHRDVKPANLLLYEEDRIKISDFGIAKLADSEMTKVGQLLGTPSYMSPEQAMGEKLDGRSDIFSLGVCAFEMLCGQQPFPGNNVTAILYKLVHVGPIEPDNLEMNGLIPQKWHEVFPKVLSKKREDRYQSAAEFVRDLEYCLGSWFTGLTPEVATQAMAVPPMPAAPALLQRNADDPSVVVSMDEIQDAMGYAGGTPGVPADDDMPQTIAMRPGEASGRARRGDSLPPTLDVKPKRGDSLPPTLDVKPTRGDSLPPTVEVKRPPAGAEEDDLPVTVAVPRPSMPAPTVQEKTIVLPPPTAAAPSAPPPAAPATPAATQKPSSAPPFKPASKAGALPAYRSPSSLASKSQIPRAPGPGSRPPGPSTRPPAQQLEDLIEDVPEPDSPPMRPGLPVAAVVGGGLALLVGVVVLIVMIAKGRGGVEGPEPTSTTQVAGPSGPGTIRVETAPAGASVLIDDQDKGPAPATITGLATGVHDVAAEARGYDSAGQRVTLTDAQPSAVVTLTLPAAKSAMGEADILSRPPGATVFMDGKKVGQTPLRGFRLRTGSRRFKLTTEGFENYVEFLKVEEGTPARLDARLVPLGSAQPSPGAATASPSAAASPTPAPTPTPTPKPPTPTPRPPPVTTQPAVVDAPTAPPTTTLATPARPSVDTTKVYSEDEVDTAPKKLSGDSLPPPKLRSGESLSLTVSWIVGENGEVGEIEVVQSGGKALDDGVVQALRKWKYAPGVKQGVKVKVKLLKKYTFRSG